MAKRRKTPAPQPEPAVRPPSCLRCPLPVCRGKITHARSDMGDGRAIHYVSCATCGTGDSYDEQPAEQPEA